MVKKSDFEYEQQIFLGGKISHKHPETKTYARLTPNTSKILWILGKIEEWETKEKEPEEIAKEIIKEFGVIDNMTNWTELTRLSAIIGDPRKRVSGKDLKKKLEKLRK